MTTSRLMEKPCFDPQSGEVYCSRCAPDIEPEAGECESDSPMHCVRCHCPLATTLTKGGVQYVIEYLLDHMEGDRSDCGPLDTLRVWAADLKDYSLDRKDRFIVNHFLSSTAEGLTRGQKEVPRSAAASRR